MKYAFSTCAFLLVACAEPRPDPTLPLAAAELSYCAQTATSWADYDACRDEVRRRHGRLPPAPDGGKP